VRLQSVCTDVVCYIFSSILFEIRCFVIIVFQLRFRISHDGSQRKPVGIET
jgi:hypothetical protein